MTISYAWCANFENSEVNALHAESFSHQALQDDDWDWKNQLNQHSLGWVCARAGADLVGFVNVAWDGAVHAFVLDTMVASGVSACLAAALVRQAGSAWSITASSLSNTAAASPSPL